jgi:hypothetical protein
MLLSGKSVELLILSIKKKLKILTLKIILCEIFHNHWPSLEGKRSTKRSEAKQINTRQAKQRRKGRERGVWPTY